MGNAFRNPGTIQSAVLVERNRTGGGVSTDH